MAKHVAQKVDSSPDADAGIAVESLTAWRERSLLWQRNDLDRALSSFTFVADVTTLAPNCSFAGDSKTLVVRYDGLPFAAIAFCRQDGAGMKHGAAERVAALTGRLVAPGEVFTCLVAEKEWQLVQAAYEVLEVHPEWQMVFCADPSSLDSGDAVALGPMDLPEMRSLADREGMQAFEHDPLTRGPWYGVRRNGGLVAQGGTHILLERAAEIGNIVTARQHRRQGYGSQIMVALLRELVAQGYQVFLHVLKENETAIAFYRDQGFECRLTMILAKCRLRTSHSFHPSGGCDLSPSDE